MIKYFLVFIITASEQILLTSENYNEPICDRKGLCYECSFNEIRQIDSCFSTGYIQPIFCTVTSSLNNTQEISYLAACSTENMKFISNFSLSWITLIFISLFLFYNWRQIKLLKSQNYQNSLANIIKT